jgi:hypothetical protein
MLKKWYFCLSESSMDRTHHGWRDLVIAAVNSARKNTHLEPTLLFDGGNNPFLQFLRDKGVRVVHHRVSFYDALAERDKQQPGYLAIASGAFLRTEIPLLETEDEYVLYTDCDVFFLKHPSALDLRPEYFACAPQMSKTDYEGDANSGVLILNIPKMRESFPKFARFIQDNLFAGWPGCDQENYRRFYKGKWDRLPLTMNWKPYWGLSADPEIVHWHGPKPEIIAAKLRRPSVQLPQAWKALYDHDKAAYEHFLDAWHTYSDPLTAEQVIGHVDTLSRSHIAGWSLYSNDKSTPVKLHAYLDGEFIGEVVCDKPRSDLARVYKTEIGGFDLRLPAQQAAAASQVVELKDDHGKSVRLRHRGQMTSAFAVHPEGKSGPTGEAGGTLANRAKTLSIPRIDDNRPALKDSSTACYPDSIGRAPMRVAAICMQKNESVMLPVWIRHHARLFGNEALTVVDNGSSDPATLKVLEAARHDGITVVDAPSAEDFERKGEIISALIKGQRDVDWIVPLDSDELLVTTSDGLGYSLEAAAIHSEFERLRASGKLIGRISSQFYNIPFTTGAIRTGAEKVLVHSASEIALDKGFHLYDWGTNRPTVDPELIAQTNFAYLHFHNRPFDDLLARAREKLKLRVPDFSPRTMTAYRGDGQHLTKYFLMNAETYRQSFPRAAVSLAPLEEYGIHVPFAAPAEDAEDRIRELRNSVNLEAHYTRTSASQEELQEFLTQLRGVRVYLEFGAGGTTRVACEYGVQRVLSVDTDLDHCTELIAREHLRPFLDTNRLQMHHVHLGVVGQLGHTLDRPHEFQVQSYLGQAALATGAQLVLVDGRYRVGCCAALYPCVNESTVILLRDYFTRPVYQAVSELYAVVRRVDGMAVLRKVNGRAEQATELERIHMNDPA